jgi:hypothetical protein
MRRRTLFALVVLAILINLFTTYARVALPIYFVISVGTSRWLPGDPVARWVGDKFLTRPAPNPVYPAPNPWDKSAGQRRLP